MADTMLTTRILIRNDTAKAWSLANPILHQGEIGIENDTNKFKFGDGVTGWNDLPYVSKADAEIAIKSSQVTMSKDFVFTVPVGTVTIPSTGSTTVVAKGKTLDEFFSGLFAKEENPTITQPSISVSLTGSGAKEVGTSITPVYTTTFNPGEYQYGPETGVVAESYSVRDTNGATSTAANGSLSEFVVADGMTYKITATVNYGEGVNPKTNFENDYPDGKIVAGSKSATSSAITGYRNSFYGSVTDKSQEITSSMIRGLAGKKNGALSAGNTFKAAEAVGAMRVIIAVPAPRTCTSIKDENGLNAEALSAFSTTTVQVEGANGYTAATYNVYYKDNAAANDKANNWVVTVG